MEDMFASNDRVKPGNGTALNKTLFCLALCALLGACAQNLANIRTLASGLQTATSDTETIVAADNASCQQNLALQQEYKLLVDRNFVLPSCDGRAAVLGSILVENKAMQAYGAALGKLADDQFVTTDTDAKSVTDMLSSVKGIDAPVATAISSVFSVIESAALNGYRQRELKKVMLGPPAEAFKTIMASFTVLSAQYSTALQNEMKNLTLIQGAIEQKHGNQEAVAVAELGYRFTTVHNDVAQKQAALADYSKAISKVEPAFEAAVKDLTNPSPKEIYESVKAFAAQVKDAHDKLKKAFG